MNKSFYRTTRIGQDNCEKKFHNNQNSAAASYMLNNFRPQCGSSSDFNFAVKSDLNFNGSYQVGIGGCNVDKNSEIFHRSLSRDKPRLSLNQRPFATVPFMGRGTRNVSMESQIQQGDVVCSRKTVNPTSEISYIGYSQTPLIPSIKSTVSNPDNLIESDGGKGWTRGGVPSRELTRDNDHE
jgi:hypothetical protein